MGSMRIVEKKMEITIISIIEHILGASSKGLQHPHQRGQRVHAGGSQQIGFAPSWREPSLRLFT